jgi:hypothetical protein
MNSIATRDRGFSRQPGRRLLWAAPYTAAFLMGCSTGPAGPNPQDNTIPIQGEGQVASDAPQTEDGLAQAFDGFRQDFVNFDFDARFSIGFGYHPGLSTEKVKGQSGQPLNGVATLDMNTGEVFAFMNDVPSSGNFDLWLVKNDPKGTVAPESKDQMLKVGSFTADEFGNVSLSASLGANINFDLDLIVLTRAGKKPNQSVVAVGDRTLFEKRQMRFRQNRGLDPVSGTLAENIETTDPLVARGAQLFFNETFGGNGRTCGTCHRAENNLTIDPKFIKKLPKTDPLFVAETNPALAKLEVPELMRSRGLILENVDGFDDPTHKFVMRGVPHTLSLVLTEGHGFAFGVPSQRLGWAGDGGPGRSTLHEFTFGAIMQHFTKTLARRPGVDFRIPTEEELDALEAFQLFTGRQGPTDFSFLFPTDPHASSGNVLFNNTGCTFCHVDTFGGNDTFNQNFDTGVANLTPDLPDDDGFLAPGDRTFNVPPLVEAADTGPFFHNNAFNTIEDAVGFYFSQTFRDSPSSFFIFNDLDTEQQGDIAAFLRVLNSASNIAQVKKRAEYIQNVRSAGNTDILKIAIADARDARVVLSDRGLSPEVQEQLRTAEDLLKTAKGDKDKDRPSTMKKVVKLLDAATAAMFTDTPPDNGGSGGSGGRGSGGFAGFDPGPGGEGGSPDASGGTAGTFAGAAGSGISTGGTGTGGGSTGTGGTSGTGGRGSGGRSSGG